MFTGRSSTLFLIAALAAFPGLLGGHNGLALVGISLIAWLGFHWFMVQLAVRSSSAMISDVTRVINGRTGDGYTIAVDQDCDVELAGKLRNSLTGFQVTIREALPQACNVVQGHFRLITDQERENGSFLLRYKIRSRVCGHMQLPGLVVSIQDSNGLFQAQRFVSLPQKLTVLPFLIRPQTTNSILKTNNLQRVAGHHRHRSAGISAELLGIRDYQPGDPPRSIAWKATAKLGMVMSREFESEVPVRATVISDISSYQFSGRPGQSVADRVITTTASVTRLLLADRDPVAIVLATESGVMRLQHGQGEKQLTRLMHHLMNSADPNPRLEWVSFSNLSQIVFVESYRRFPELYDRRCNFIPLNRSLLKPVRGKKFRIRNRMAAVLCETLGMPVGFEARLIYDDQVFRETCLAWAARYQIGSVRVVPEPHNFEKQRNLSADAICQNLMNAVARAKDNELFVVVASFSDCAPAQESFLDAIRVCRSRNHRVIYIDAGSIDMSSGFSDPVAIRLANSSLAKINRERSSDVIHRQLTSLGVACSQIQAPRLIETVANQVHLIRSGASRGGGASRAGALAAGGTMYHG